LWIEGFKKVVGRKKKKRVEVEIGRQE